MAGQHITSSFEGIRVGDPRVLFVRRPAGRSRSSAAAEADGELSERDLFASERILEPLRREKSIDDALSACPAMVGYAWKRIENAALPSICAKVWTYPAAPCSIDAMRKSGIGEKRLDHTRNAKTSFVPDFLITTLATLHDAAPTVTSSMPCRTAVSDRDDAAQAEQREQDARVGGTAPNQGLLLRPSKSLATRLERKHEWTPEAVFA